MNSRERVFAHLNGQPVDHLPLLPITMQFACRQIGSKYREWGIRLAQVPLYFVPYSVRARTTPCGYLLQMETPFTAITAPIIASW
jgi:hypothetical protein